MRPRHFWLLGLALTLAGGPALAAISIPANQWVKQAAPSVTKLTGFTGDFQARGWNHMLYDPVGRRMVLFDGYTDATHPYSIYANAIWTYDPVANRLSLQKVNNWTRQNGKTVPLPANSTDPTPFDRHSYSCTAIVPEKNRLYMWGGANSSVGNDYIGDTWVFDFATNKWRMIDTPTHPFNVFEQTMTFDPTTNRLVLFGGASSSYQNGDGAWLFNVATETWEAASTAGGATQRTSQSMVYDPIRRVSWMFGGGAYPNPGNELWSFDAASATWSRVTPSGPVPSPRRFGAMAYDSRHDIVMLWGGIYDTNSLYNDTWILHPSTKQWVQLSPPVSPPTTDMNSEDLAYDEENDVFVLHQNGVFWLFRYAPSGDEISPNDVGDLRMR
ncbi:MAG TPA: kelch repeat-containing protein [Candidatus Eisenbacteria bacterium]|nr:kelch repeat-containing protein [Candidatus Eisenbacteria bacterium]